jgi:probable phosphomutase (TIGR03848 family)
MLLLLVRHALTAMTGKRLTGWLPGHHLSDEGRAQASALAERMSQVPLAAIYSSPLERCKETAAEIAKGRKLRVKNLKDAGEIKYGDWQGKTLKSLYRTKAWSELNRSRGDFRFPNGETPREAQTRGVKAVEELRRAHQGQVIALVSHADLIRLITAGYLGLALEMYNRITVAPATVSAISFVGQFPSVVALNHPGNLEAAVEFMQARNRPKAR